MRAPRTSPLLALACGCVSVRVGWAQTPNNCTYTETNPDGSFHRLDFSRLNTGTGSSTVVPGGVVTINPCASVPTCSGSCCIAVTGGTIVNCGTYPNVRFVKTLTWMRADYAVGMVVMHGVACNQLEPTRLLESQIAFICDKTAGDPGILRPDVTYNASTCNLRFTWKTAMVCALAPTAPSIPDDGDVDGMTGGTVFSVVVLVVLGVYCILGTILTSQKPNASDRCYNNVPHKQFWGSLPGLVGDGFAFVLSGGSTASGKARGYEEVAPESGKDYGTGGGGGGDDYGAGPAEHEASYAEQEAGQAGFGEHEAGQAGYGGVDAKE